MNAQDFRSLQEAYMEVYSSTEEIDEATATPPSKFNVRKGLDAKSRRLRRSSDFYAYGKDPDPEERKISTSKGEGGITKNPKKLRKQKALGEIGEQVDLYDIILSHLLDEGYAETPEAAEVIMVNMSEDWRESIVEEVLDEELTGARYKRAMEKAGGREALGKIPMTLAARVAVGREGQPLEVARKDPRNSVRTTTKGPTKRGGSGFKRRTKSDFQGVDDTVGSGNKAARRAGKKVKDTSDDL